MKTEEKDKSKDFILSDGSQKNSHGFRVDLSGGRFERFNSNPVMLYDHDTNQLIGRWENIRVENDKLMATPVFDLGDSLAAEKARKVKDGFLKGASIALHIIKLDKIAEEYVASEWELMEASITPIPSDAGAVRLYNEKREVLTFEQVKLSFNNNNALNFTKMVQETTIKLSAATCIALGLSGNFTERDIELAVAEKDKTIGDLRKELETEREEKIKAFLSSARKDGRIDAKTEQNLLKLAKVDFPSVKEFVDSIEIKPSASLKDVTMKSTLSAERENWTYLDWMKKDSKGLERLKVENPTEFERLKSKFN